MSVARFSKLYLCLAAILLLLASNVYAQSLRVVMVETMPVPVVTDHENFFLSGLEKLGYHAGKNLVVDKIEAQGSEALAKEKLRKYLAGHEVDVVVSFATLASRAAKEVLEGTDIPLVFCVVSDPVGAGLIEEVGLPTKTNVTGLVFSLMRKSKMELAKELLTQPFPDRPVRVGVVLSSYPAAVNDLKAMRGLGGQIEFESFSLEYRAMPDGLDAMLADARKGVTTLSPEIDYWWIVPGPLGETMEFSDLLLQSGVPVGLCHTKECTRNGGLFFVTPNYEDSGFQVAGMVDSIFKGTAPGDIPPVPPDSFELGINLKTAIELQIVIPSEIMELAGKNVWR